MPPVMVTTEALRKAEEKGKITTIPGVETVVHKETGDVLITGTGTQPYTPPVVVPTPPPVTPAPPEPAPTTTTTRPMSPMEQEAVKRAAAEQLSQQLIAGGFGGQFSPSFIQSNILGEPTAAYGTRGATVQGPGYKKERTKEGEEIVTFYGGEGQQATADISNIYTFIAEGALAGTVSPEQIQLENILNITSLAMKSISQQGLVAEALGSEGATLLATRKLTVEEAVTNFQRDFARGIFPTGVAASSTTTTAMASRHLQGILDTTAYDVFGRRTPRDITITALQKGIVWPEEVKTKPAGIYYKEGVQEEPRWDILQKNLFEAAEARVNEYLLYGESAWYRVREAVPIPGVRDIMAGFVRGAEGIVKPIVEWIMGATLPQPVYEVGGLFESPVGVPGISVAQPSPIMYVGELAFYQGLFMAGTTAAKTIVGASMKMTEALVRYTELEKPWIRTQWEATKVGITGAKEGIIAGVLGEKVAELLPSGRLIQYRTGGFFEPIVYPYQMAQFKVAEFMADIGKGGIPYLLPGEIPANIVSKVPTLKPYDVISIVPGGGVFETRLAAKSVWHSFEPSGKFFGLVTPVTPTSIGWSATKFSTDASRINTFLKQVSSTEMLTVKTVYEKIGANVLFPISEIPEPAWASLRLSVTYLPPYEKMVGGFKPSIISADYTTFGKQITESSKVAWLDRKEVPETLQRMMDITWVPPSEVPVSTQISAFLASFEPRATIEPYKVATGVWGKTPIWKSAEDATAMYANPKKWAKLYRAPREPPAPQQIVSGGRQLLVLETPTVETPLVVTNKVGVGTWAGETGQLMTGASQLNWAQQALMYKRLLQLEYSMEDYEEMFSPFIAHPLVVPRSTVAFREPADILQAGYSIVERGMVQGIATKNIAATITKDIQTGLVSTKAMQKTFSVETPMIGLIPMTSVGGKQKIATQTLPITQIITLTLPAITQLTRTSTLQNILQLPLLKSDLATPLMHKPVGTAFDVYVKRKQAKRGKGSYISRGYEKLDVEPLSREAAMGAGMATVDKWANASFIIKPAPGHATPHGEYERLYRQLAPRFRSPIVRGQQVPSNRFIEKTAFRISTPEEKEAIPYEAARLRKARYAPSKQKRAARAPDIVGHGFGSQRRRQRTGNPFSILAMPKLKTGRRKRK